MVYILSLPAASHYIYDAIDLKKLKLIEVIGQGSFGVVHLERFPGGS